MKKNLFNLLLFLILLLIYSCSAPKYFYDESSYQRQKELHNCRSGNVFCDIMTGVGSVVAGAVLDAEVQFYPSMQQFKKLNLVNPTNDTIYVNMLTDVFWDKQNYCDFMDIRIPPHLNCKVLVPVEANYNLYFSNTQQSDDDEMLEIFTSNVKRIALYPGLTTFSDTIQ
ncbi:hypothetical protein OU798_19290 [Prolixibacteraceae bacterium Z1-6]|uniref:Lipoprotein n=1 Tax=Draconibacterium aestuarii TaxID=2998507 RepID=A0A9X3J7H8_9BACT|nr:hypothetical protein [Prolixibacteraceae bacterium Z1-6]